MSALKSFSFLSLLLMALAVGCSEPADPDAGSATDQAVASSVNPNCPITGSPVASDVTTERGGKTIGFCCADCIPTWDELSEEQKQAKLDAAMQPNAESDGHGGHQHGE